MDFVTSGPEAIVFERACPRRLAERCATDETDRPDTFSSYSRPRGGGNWAAIRPSIHPSVCRDAVGSQRENWTQPCRGSVAGSAAHHKRRHPVLFYYVIGRAVIYYIFKFTRGFAQIGLSLIDTHRPILTPSAAARSFLRLCRRRVKTNFALSIGPARQLQLNMVIVVLTKPSTFIPDVRVLLPSCVHFLKCP